MYADFEAILKPIEAPKPNPEESYTKVINQHIPSGFCAYSEFSYGKVENPLKPYRGKDCVEVLCDHIENKTKRPYHTFPEKPMKPLTLKQWQKCNRATKCHTCFKKFLDLNPKVRDHCHYTGQYRGPAHRSCNLMYNTNDIGVIAEYKEKYISFTIDIVVDQYVDALDEVKEKKIELRFIDSIRFMASSLDSLSSNLVGVSGMVCNECGGSCEFNHVNEDYIAHGKCRYCYSGYSKDQLSKLTILILMNSLDY